jgi:hypothetical protein
MPIAFDAPLFQTMFSRRTRRFPLGGRLPSRRAGLGYTSAEKPVALDEVETALLCFAASGTTGATVEEIRHLMGHLTATGRATASPCASLTLELFLSNDYGVFYYRTPSPEDVVPKRRVRIETLADREWILADYRSNAIRIGNVRLPIPRETIGSAFESMVDLPGTTLFIPIAETTREYVNMLLTCLAQFRWQLWDEVKDQPAGVGRWIDNGILDGDRVSIYQYEAMLPWICNLEAGMAVQNLSLAAQAMGLGAFPMHTVDLRTVMRLLNVRFEPVKGKGYPQATPNSVGIDGLVEGYCPPYRDPECAVDAIVERKWGAGGIYGARGYDLPRPKLFDSLIEAAKAYCSYVYNTYGRFPKYQDALFIPILVQIHHLDLGFYEKHFPEHLGEMDRAHMQVWHRGLPGA